MMGLCALCLGLQERQGGRLLAAWETVSLQWEAGCSCQSIQVIGYGALTRNSDLCLGSRTCDATISPLEAGLQCGCLLGRLPW